MPTQSKILPIPHLLRKLLFFTWRKVTSPGFRVGTAIFFSLPLAVIISFFYSYHTLGNVAEIFHLRLYFREIMNCFFEIGLFCHLQASYVDYYLLWTGAWLISASLTKQKRKRDKLALGCCWLALMAWVAFFAWWQITKQQVILL